MNTQVLQFKGADVFNLVVVGNVVAVVIEGIVAGVDSVVGSVTFVVDLWDVTENSPSVLGVWLVVNVVSVVFCSVGLEGVFVSVAFVVVLLPVVFAVWLIVKLEIPVSVIGNWVELWIVDEYPQIT